MAAGENDRLNGFTALAAMKNPCDVATTANITLSGEQTIDSVVTNESRVLVKNQTDTTENGIYCTGTSAWTRQLDFDGNRDVLTGTTVFITSGTTQNGQYWYVSTAGDPNPGESMDFLQAPLSGAVTAVNVSYDNSTSGMTAEEAQAAIDELAENRILAKGTSIASAATTVLGDANSSFVSITGTTTITSFGSTGFRDHVWAQFDGTLTLTHNGTSLILPTSANITTAAGDMMLAVRTSLGNWKVAVYQRVDGTALIGTSTFNVTDQTAITSLQDTDQLVVADASDSDLNKKITFINLTASLTINTAQLAANAATIAKLGTDVGYRELIETIVASNDVTIDFVSNIDSTYDKYEIEIIGLVPATDATKLYLLTSTDTGSSFDTGATDYSWVNHNANSGGSGNNGSNGGTEIQITDNVVGNNTGEALNGTIELFRPSDADYFTAGFSAKALNTSAQAVVTVGSGTRLTAADVDAVRFLMSSGNITSGTFKLYGVK